MKFSTKAQSFDSFQSDGLLIGVFAGTTTKGATASIDKALGGHFKRAMKAKRFEGKPGQTISVDTLGKHPAGKIVVVGLGKEKELTPDIVRRAAALGAKTFREAGVKKYGTTLASAPLNKMGQDTLAQAVVEGTALALYTFDRLKKEKTKKKVDNVTLLAAKRPALAKLNAGVKKGTPIAEAACFARDLVNLPSNIATPTYLAVQAKSIASKFGAKCSVLGPQAIKRLGMGGLVAVSQGSNEPARFIVLEWMKGGKKKKPIVIVGKGLTFDTGGISLKPSADMHEMKSDMSGGAAAIGVMRAVAALKLKANLVCLIPTTENMPGGSAIKPGDVVKGLSGVTMEILNTDAEGRLILSDALAYAKRYKPDCVVDMATLTGACAVALGPHASGLFGNDDKLIEQIREAGEETGERCWPMPLWPEYDDDIKSDVADVQNIGPRWGGAITAAAFLKKHVNGKWAHVDIAGTAFGKRARHYLTKGGAGIGVRLMVNFIEQRAKLR